VSIYKVGEKSERVTTNKGEHTMEQLTELETRALQAISFMVQCYAGAVIANKEVWSASVCDYGDIDGLQLSGAISSLSKKGYVKCYPNKDPNESTLELTAIGLAYYLENIAEK